MPRWPADHVRKTPPRKAPLKKAPVRKPVPVAQNTDTELDQQLAESLPRVIDPGYTGHMMRVAGKPWAEIAEAIPTITTEQRDLLYAVATHFNAMRHDAATRAGAGWADRWIFEKIRGLRPGDDYNARTSWSDILTGWTRVRRLGTGWAWRRPSKDDRGCSVTLATSPHRLRAIPRLVVGRIGPPADVLGCLGEFVAVQPDDVLW